MVGETTHDLALRLNAAFMTLPPEMRAALWLHTVEQEDLAEVANTLEQNPSAVERLVGEGLRELRQFLWLVSPTPEGSDQLRPWLVNVFIIILSDGGWMRTRKMGIL